VIKQFIDVGIAIKNLEAAVATYSRVLGVTPRMLTHTDYAYPGLKGARFYLGNATISLVASDDARTPIARFIETRGEGVNHLTWRSPISKRTSLTWPKKEWSSSPTSRSISLKAESSSPTPNRCTGFRSPSSNQSRASICRSGRFSHQRIEVAPMIPPSEMMMHPPRRWTGRCILGASSRGKRSSLGLRFAM
jgi:hypothetical protein